MSVCDLGHRLRLDSGTLTPLLKRLEAAGLVSRLRDPADERRVLVSVTAAGDALQDELAHVPGAVIERVGMGAEEWMALRHGLDRPLAAVDADRKSVVEGKRESVRVDLGGRRIRNKKQNTNKTENNNTNI